MPVSMNMGENPMSDIVSPRLQLTEITSGEMFTRLLKAFGDISADKDNKKEISENCEEIKRVLRADFGIETTVCVLSPVDQVGFFGFNVYPNPKEAKAIIDALIANKPQEIKSIWQHITRWHVEIDGRLFYDMNKIRAMHEAGFCGDEKLYVYGAMELYLDFINIFLRVLSLFGKRKN